jgi:hypothetical protein
MMECFDGGGVWCWRWSVVLVVTCDACAGGGVWWSVVMVEECGAAGGVWCWWWSVVMEFGGGWCWWWSVVLVKESGAGGEVWC